MGDLVYVDEAAAASSADEVVDADDAAETAEDGEETDAEPAEVQSRFRTMVRALTAADVAGGKYTMADVVLPLPGHDITYPSNECGEWYRERLARDGLTSETLKQKQK